MLYAGFNVQDLPTPVLLLDLEKFNWNIEKMFAFSKKVGVNIRPHAKTFKSAAICNRLIEAGAIGIMTQKLSEADVLLNSGILYGNKNILISQELTDPSKIECLVGYNVAMEEGKVLTSLDDLREAEIINKIAERWGTKQHVIIEMSHGRCGTPPGQPTVDLAKKIQKMPSLVFRGIYGYENPVKQEVALQRNKQTVDTANMIREAGIPVEIVSAGSTATYEVTGTYPGITEIEPGSFVFGVGPEGSGYGWKAENNVYFKNSLSVLTSIISTTHEDRVVTDAGSKVFGAPNTGVVPPVLAYMNNERIGFERAGFSEEHCTLQFKEGSEERKKLHWGQKISLTPNHCCTTVNQHEKIFVIKNNKVVTVWPITARGMYL
ncbi:alanine racemase [Candidatus Bathyarchaeota archaeon]|nr:alanine racemase [Candidatus Bathyarchaeota archaeon]